jgi:hypothetical protein
MNDVRMVICSALLGLIALEFPAVTEARPAPAPPRADDDGKAVPLDVEVTAEGRVLEIERAS